MSLKFPLTVALLATVMLPVRPLFAMHATDAGRHSLLSVRGQFGVLNGEAREVVYAGKSSPGNEDYKISELIWDIKSVAMAGVAVSFSGGPLTLNLGLWAGINEGSGGEMYNYDWMEPSIPVWTDKSRSEVDVINAAMLDLNMSFALFDNAEICLSIVGGLKYSEWEWDDRGQEFVYSVNSFRDTVGSFEGLNVIDYEQVYVVPYAGIEGAARLGRLSLHGYILYSALVYAEDDDHHILRELNFTGTFTGGEYMAFGVSASFDINDSIFVQLALDHQKVDEIIGDMKIIEYDEAYSDAAGISHESTMVSASLGIKL